MVQYAKQAFKVVETDQQLFFFFDCTIIVILSSFLFLDLTSSLSDLSNLFTFFILANTITVFVLLLYV